MHYTFDDIKEFDFKYRLNLINSVTGIKPANLIGSISESGNPNLAIFSSIVHLGSDPPLLGFIMRPHGEVPRNTYENIKQTEYYTINHVHAEFYERAHYTSAKFAADVSEFDACRLAEEYLFDFKAPFVKESQLKMGMRLVDEIPISLNDTTMIIGRIEHLVVDDTAVNERGRIDLESLKDVGLSGLNRYYKLTKLDELPYARVEEIPDFKS